MSQWMGETSVHELYTAACGLYIGWVVCRILAVLLSWVPLGLSGVAKKFLEWVMLVLSFYRDLLGRADSYNQFGKNHLGVILRVDSVHTPRTRADQR